MAIEAKAGATVGEYILISKLGEGGMAQVWLARHRVDGALQAIKFLNHQYQGIAHVEARFLLEGQSQFKLRHPNIVRVETVGQHEGGSFLVMEYVQGQDLEKILNVERGGLSVTESVQIAQQVLAGLGCAHANGIVHRDIKPSNVLVDEDGRALVMDFGIAKVLSTDGQSSRSMTVATSRLGTVDYMSPEQIRNPRDVDRRSDIYSFGCLFYEVLTGRPPFSKKAGYRTEEDVRAAHITYEPLPPAQVERDLPPELNSITLRCLAKAKEDRPQTCEEIIYALDQYRQSHLSRQSSRETTVVLPPVQPNTSPRPLSPTGPIPFSPAPATQSPIFQSPAPPHGTGGYGADSFAASSYGTGSPSAHRVQTTVDPNRPSYTGPASQGSFAPSIGVSRAPTQIDQSDYFTGTPNPQQYPSSGPSDIPRPFVPIPARRTPWALVGAGGVLIVAALAGGGWFLLHQGQEKAATVAQTTPAPATEVSQPKQNPQPQRPIQPDFRIPDSSKKQPPVLIGDTPSNGSNRKLPHSDDIPSTNPKPQTTTTGPTSGDLFWSGYVPPMTQIQIYRAQQYSIPAGLSGTMFPAEPVTVTIEPAGSAIPVWEGKNMNNSQLNIRPVKPGQQTIHIHWQLAQSQ